MSATRHNWLHNYHTENPFSRSLTKPITIVESEDVDVEAPARSPLAGETLACSRYDFMFPYRDQYRQHHIGLGRVWLPPHAESSPEQRSIPAVLSIHYEIGLPGVSQYLAEGWACFTPTGIGEDHLFNLVGPGMDHSLEMVKLLRRLPFIDLQRIGWQGGSAGGYQCLMAMEALWPVACAHAVVPVSDVHYNLQCIEWSNRYNEGITDNQACTIPITRMVEGIVSGTRRGLAGDLEAAWLQHSAPCGASLIRSPLIIHSSTADLLCPSPQIGADFERVPERGTMPPGWTNSYERFHHSGSLGKPLNEWIPREDIETICIAIPETAPRVDIFPPPEGVEPPEKTAIEMVKPFSRDNLVTIVIQDEGAPDPRCAHTKYMVDMDMLPSYRHHFARGYVPVDHLTPPLLMRLIGRYNPETVQNATLPAIRRGYDEFDRYEVLLALRTYTGDGAHIENVEALRTMYAEMPPVQRGLDVRQDGVDAAFSEDPMAAILYHEAVLFREKGELALAEACETQLATEYTESTWAKLKTTS